jgi:hypothetical protein
MALVSSNPKPLLPPVSLALEPGDERLHDGIVHRSLLCLE